MSYLLHYAPDNASLIIRLALEEVGAPYTARLVDRGRDEQKSAAYLALNPSGLIPTLETPDGALFETGAILLWLAARHGRLFPKPGDETRGTALSRLFFLSNTLHASLRILFYPQQYAGAAPALQALLRNTTQIRLLNHFAVLESIWQFDPQHPVINDLYLVALLRWVQLYPLTEDKSWFDLKGFPTLHAMAGSLEDRASTKALQDAEGLGPTPFTAPRAPIPPEGSAT